MNIAESRPFIVCKRTFTLRWRLTLWMTGLSMGLNAILMFFILTFVVKSDALLHLSFLGMSVMTLLTGACAYWSAGMALRPVKRISQAAHKISANTLRTRLSQEGPNDELKELALSFNAMLNRLERSFEQQGRFVADAAHELRTPLATLRTNVEVISTEPDATPYDYKTLFGTVERNLTRLEHLVTDLLLLTTEEPTLTHNTLSLSPLLENVLVELKPLADTQCVTLSSDEAPDIWIRGDSTLLSHVFSNLVENAIRYNHVNGSVQVKAYHDDTWAIISITDTGSGIAPEEQHHIFDRFYRVDRSRTRHKGGAGLGLSIVSHIVQQYGGQIEVESKLNYGSTFKVRLPL